MTGATGSGRTRQRKQPGRTNSFNNGTDLSKPAAGSAATSNGVEAGPQPQPSPDGAAADASQTITSSDCNVRRRKQPCSWQLLTALCAASTAINMALLASLAGCRPASLAASWWPMGGGPGAAGSLGALHNTSQPRGVRSVSEARGIFPRGCRWRDVQHGGQDKKFWAVEEYEYWDAHSQAWTSQRPDACIVQGVRNPARYNWRGNSPRTEVNCTASHCIYQNLWYNNGRFYLLVDGNTSVTGWKMTRNQDLNVLHIDNATAFVEPLEQRVISGDTLIFDFVYFLHPTAIGHWSEMMFPLFSILRREPAFAKPPAQFVLLHLKRVHLMEWVRAVVAVTLGVASHADLPPLVMQAEGDSVWTQIVNPLEGYGGSEWVCWERALVVRDIFTGGTRTFLSREDAQAFRANIYQQYGLPPPRPTAVPRVITFQRKRANRRVVNEEAMLAMLAQFGEVRVVEFNASTSFGEQLRVMSTTGVLISVHTSNLANAQFLPPGAAVVELLQRNWVWHNLDRSFQVQTEMMGDIHHFAWRARHRNQTVYINKRDAERFGDWTHEQCATEDCVEAHTNVDVVVDVPALQALLADRLPLVFAGVAVAEAALPWPPP